MISWWVQPRIRNNIGQIGSLLQVKVHVNNIFETSYSYQEFLGNSVWFCVWFLRVVVVVAVAQLSHTKTCEHLIRMQT